MNSVKLFKFVLPLKISKGCSDIIFKKFIFVKVSKSFYFAHLYGPTGLWLACDALWARQTRAPQS